MVESEMVGGHGYSELSFGLIHCPDVGSVTKSLGVCTRLKCK